jgi:hypothetical protein
LSVTGQGKVEFTCKALPEDAHVDSQTLTIPAYGGGCHLFYSSELPGSFKCPYIKSTTRDSGLIKCGYSLDLGVERFKLPR